jgi:hypothetical protein
MTSPALSTCHSPAFAHDYRDGVRWISGALVLFAHFLVVAFLLFYATSNKHPLPASPAMLLLTPAPPAQIQPPPSSAAANPLRNLTAPTTITLPTPLFSIQPPSADAPKIAPNPNQAAKPEAKSMNDLFSPTQKGEFKQFFKNQAVEDARENAKAATVDHSCDDFMAPADRLASTATLSNGITKNFLPGFAVTKPFGGPGENEATRHSCN